MSADVPTTCVVLAPQSAGPEMTALQALVRERGWRRDQAADALSAMSLLCLHQRIQSSEKSWRDPASCAPSRLALVVCAGRDGDAPDRAALLAAVDRYLPSVEVWSFDGAALARLRGGAEAPEARAAPGAVENGAAPRGDGGERARDSAEPGEGPTTISAEELDMLLGDFSGDEP